MKTLTLADQHAASMAEVLNAVIKLKSAHMAHAAALAVYAVDQAASSSKDLEETRTALYNAERALIRVSLESQW